MGTTVVSLDGNPNLIDGWIFLGIKNWTFPFSRMRISMKN